MENGGTFSATPNSGVAWSTNIMDANNMPSEAAQAARERAKEIMLALEDGKPGDAGELTTSTFRSLRLTL